ncbi:DUF5667 domain-containing protein [Chloroflexota bacterium]
MGKEKEFDSILDECLERLLVSGETIEQCLQSYPEQASDLEPLLQTALAARQAVIIQPRVDFKAQARYQFRSALQEWTPQRRRSFFRWFPRWAVVVSIVVAVLLMGGGTVAAAGYSMPDSFLYPVKLATEQVQLTLTPSDVDKAELCAKFADRRVAEIVHMANKGDAQRVETVSQRLDEWLTKLASLASAPEAAEAPQMLEEALPRQFAEDESSQGMPAKNNWTKFRTTVTRYSVDHPAVLRAVLEKAPESAKPALRRAIAISEAGYRKTLKGLD